LHRRPAKGGTPRNDSSSDACVLVLFSKGIALSASIKKKDIVELEISDLAYGGKSVAELDGLVVLIRGGSGIQVATASGIPGDVVKVQITKRKSNYAEARILEIVKESDLRTKPICSHFGLCGGCTWQDLKYEEQLKFKTKQVKESLIHIGGFQDVPIQEALGSDETFFYRNKMEYAFAPDTPQHLVLGLHPRGRFDRVFDLKQCFLQSENANRIVDFVRAFARDRKLIPYDYRERSGFLRFLTIREGKNTSMTMVNLVTNKGEFPSKDEFSSRLLTNFPFIKSVVRNINSKLANIAVGEEEELLAGDRTITEKLGKFKFEISSNSFFQTNTHQAEKLYDIVLNMADLQGDESVLDLYCGNGTISIFLSQRAKKVIGVESVEESIENARRNAALNGVTNCEFICGEVKKLLAKFSAAGGSAYGGVDDKQIPDLVVVDPPRAGLHKHVVKSLLNMKPPKIIYVSCNPSTLARDLKYLCEEYYKLERVQPIDMFPHTYHIETVVKLSSRISECQASA
jgi:23S rRNA (uracil1939-C5)-methyltransferase